VPNPCRDNAAVRRIALSTAVITLLAPATASAHGSIVPTAAVPGTVQRFVVTVPSTVLGGPDVVGFTLTVPEKARVESAESNQPRWVARVSGRTITWEGGPVEELGEDFAFRARLPESEGAVTFQGEERYGDGSGARFPLAVTVSRAAGPAGGGVGDSGDDDLAWIAIALAGTALLLALGAAIAAGALWVRLVRRPR
jgi:uncharacterized protein YcnI